MNMKKINTFILSLASASVFAGGMGPVPQNLLIFEAGASYSHAFYKNNVRTAESYAPATPNGFFIDGDDFYPNDFFGGYIGLSYYMPHWLLNTRLDMYGEEKKYNYREGSSIHMAPARVSMTIDRVFGDINHMSYGIGGGLVMETLNEGAFFEDMPDATQPFSETIGRTRFDPTVEAFAMYRMDNNFGVKFNVAYQIPVNSLLSNGDLNLNLGVNYAFPV